MTGRIMVVEDETVIAAELKDRLENLGFAALSGVSSGERAIEMARENRPDLILMDIMLEGEMDGIEAAEHIRKKFDIPVVFLTAFSDDETLARAKIAEPHGYVTKPFEDRELHIVIEMALYKHKMEREVRRYEEHLEDMLEERTRELRALKEFNERIVRDMQEGIITDNEEGYITFANPRMLEMLGLSEDEVIQKHWTLLVSGDMEMREEEAKLRDGGHTRYEAALITMDGETEVLVSATPVFDNGNYAGSIKVFTDITERKQAEERLRRNILRYKVDKGGSYLVTEKALDLGLDVLGNLLEAGFKAMVITRSPPVDIRERLSTEIEVLWLGEEGKGALPPHLDLLEKTVKDFMVRDRVVLIDRLDYLVVQRGFNNVLMFVQKLREMAYSTGAILLVDIDPATLSGQEFALLEKEFAMVESKYRADLEEGSMEVLRFIKKEIDAGRSPVQKDIIEALDITLPTASKRIKALKAKGLITDRKKGRYKILELTDRGRETLV